MSELQSIAAGLSMAAAASSGAASGAASGRCARSARGGRRAGGLALAMGELDALLVALVGDGGVAVLFDFRVGAVLLILMLPVRPSTLFPHS